MFTQLCDLEQVANIKIANENTFSTHEVLVAKCKDTLKRGAIPLSYFFFFLSNIY